MSTVSQYPHGVGVLDQLLSSLKYSKIFLGILSFVAFSMPSVPGELLTSNI